MMQLFLDESGECSFSSNSFYEHFLITSLSIDPSKVPILKNRLKRKYSIFIKAGWDKNREFKAFDLFKDKRFGYQAIVDVLNVIASVDSIQVSYLVVKKDNIKNKSFRDAPYGTAYNYFCGVLLSELVFIDNLTDIQLTFDKRNKETHPNKHFCEYLETKIYGIALEKDIDVNMTTQGADSQQTYGLQAVDFCSWGIFRKFESNDNRFYQLLQNKFLRKREWYIEQCA